MEQAKEDSQALTAVVFVLTGIVFVLDLITPSELAVWSLYLFPLGFSRWSHVKGLTVGLAGMCTVLIIIAHFYDPGPILEIAIIDRVFGLIMVWGTTFFLKEDRN